MRNSYFASTLIAGLLTLTGVLLHGQATQSSILGNITDSSGAAVANASVTVKNEGTNSQREVAADANGDYRVSGLESDGGDLFYCGGGESGKVRAVRRPKATA